MPLQYSGLGNPMDRVAWQATVHGVTRVRQDVTTKEQQCSIIYVYPAFFTHSSINGHLGCFHILAVVNTDLFKNRIILI